LFQPFNLEVNGKKKFFWHKKSAIVISVIVALVFYLTTCISKDGDKKVSSEQNNDFKKFAGSAVCSNCHKDIYDKHIHTEHHLTSAPSSPQNVIGSFDSGKNVFAFGPFLNVTMEKRDSGMYQVEYNNDLEIRRGRFDIVVGSGRKGQSYLNWIGNRLVQLPITYFTPASQWSNSPGYSPQRPMFYRPITSRCLECHSTYFEKISDTAELEEFDHHKIIYAVDCEKCHGPGASHVEFQSKNPGKEARYIVNPGKLPRERQLDLCRLCHGGGLAKTKPSFRFQAGDTLTNYFTVKANDHNAGNIDVHGNQFGLLSFSKCFNMSNLTCMSCHSIHENENGKVEIFSQRCANCHNESAGKICKMTHVIGPSISNNCIDCHMPKELSHAVSVYLQGDEIPTSALMRTHYIKVYPDAAEKFLRETRQKKSYGKN